MQLVIKVLRYNVVTLGQKFPHSQWPLNSNIKFWHIWNRQVRLFSMQVTFGDFFDRLPCLLQVTVHIPLITELVLLPPPHATGG